MQKSNLSPWTNNWVEVFDFTPNKKAGSGEPNFTIKGSITSDLILPLKKAQTLAEMAKEATGEEIKSLDEIAEEDKQAYLA